jgi:flagellar biosynthesis/type III secretory pathway M-ring protein FliF/YscJ|tara:strand:- start:408 stop:515 length:108 start_codon:yes stop_codon:yes gene_type:complete
MEKIKSIWNSLNRNFQLFLMGAAALIVISIISSAL